MYRRRRITVFVLALIVVALLVLGVTLMVKAIGKVREQASQPAPVEAVAEPTAPGPEGDAASGNCPAGEVGVKAAVNAEEFPKGEKPQFTIEVTNGHDADCLIDVGTSQQEFVVRHDGDTVWSSEYCRSEDDDAESRIVFTAGESKKTTFTWNRIPVDDSCRQVGDDFSAGDYEVVVKLGDQESEPVPFVLQDADKGAGSEDDESASPEPADEPEESVEPAETAEAEG